MGVTFRSGSYVRFVRLGGRTIKDGEAAVIWNSQGISRLVVGPQRVTLWYSTVRFLDRCKAEAHEYLKLRYRDGRVEHIHGPISMYINPALHDAVEVKQGVQLGTKDDCITVFSGTTVAKSTEGPVEGPSEDNKLQTTTTSKRRVVYGPRVHFPAPGEVVHTFQWKSPSPDVGKAQLVDSEKMSFQVLSTSKTFFWNTKLLLLSSDAHHVPVELSISYQIASVEKCAQAQDPFQALEPALLHDANRCSLTEASIRTSDLTKASFPSFCEAMNNVGFRLMNIQVLASKESIESKMAADKLAKKEAERTMDERIQETKTVHDQKLEYLKGLQDLGVDLTKVLVASAGKVDFEVDGSQQA